MRAGKKEYTTADVAQQRAQSEGPGINGAASEGGPKRGRGGDGERPSGRLAGTRKC